MIPILIGTKQLEEIKMINVSAVGRLTKGADLRTTGSGKQVGNFSLACKRSRPDKDGNVPTTYMNCVIWGTPAMVLAKYAQKGSMISVVGELQSRSYDDQQGRTHYVTELVVDNFQFLESKETIAQREQKQNEIISE